MSKPRYSEVLRPCPFCIEGSTHLQESDEVLYPKYRVIHYCGFKGGIDQMTIFTKWCETPSEARDLWNRRNWKGEEE